MLVTTLQVPELREGKEFLFLPQGRVDRGDNPRPLPLSREESASDPSSV